MHFINPMTEEGIRPYKGRRVCAVLCDGTHHYGTITDVRDGHLVLDGPCNQSATVCSTKKTKSKTNKSASISQFYPGYGYGYGYGYGRGLALSLGLLALLFLI